MSLALKRNKTKYGLKRKHPENAIFHQCLVWGAWHSLDKGKQSSWGRSKMKRILHPVRHPERPLNFHSLFLHYAQCILKWYHFSPISIIINYFHNALHNLMWPHQHKTKSQVRACGWHTNRHSNRQTNGDRIGGCNKAVSHLRLTANHVIKIAISIRNPPNSVSNGQLTILPHWSG